MMAGCRLKAVGWRTRRDALARSASEGVPGAGGDVAPGVHSPRSRFGLVFSGRRLRSPASSLQPPASRRLRRRAITLTEVLISMFVLMIGLLGVAAMIPAGRHEILEGAKIDNATAVGRAAFRDLKIRGYLNPANWRLANGTSVVLQPPNPPDFPTQWFLTSNTFNQTNPPSVTPAVAIDPLGITAPAGTYTNLFPYQTGAPQLYLTRIYPDYQISGLATDQEKRAAADLVFRASDDLLFTPSVTGRDNPPQQSVFGELGGNPVMQSYSELTSAGGTPQKRASEGNYSWLATIVTDPTSSALSSQLTVSVAVFYKRDLSSPALTERIGTNVSFFGSGISGGEITFTHPAPPPGTQPKALKPGQWVMLAGRRPPTRDFYRWYRVVAADVMEFTNPNWNQKATLAGADWDTTIQPQIWMFDNIVTVYEKNMRLEIE